MGKRLHVRAVAGITARNLDDPEAPASQARDVGVGGLFLLRDTPLEIGTTQRLVIEHQETRIEVEARVVRVEQGGVALSFCDSSDGFVAAMHKLLVDLVYEGAALADKRRAQRFRSDCPVLWVLGSASYRSTLDDLSRLGATIKAERSPAPGTEIYVQLPIIELRGDVAVVEEVHGCRAEVVRCTDEGFAVEFIGKSEGFGRAIQIWKRRER